MQPSRRGAVALPGRRAVAADLRGRIAETARLVALAPAAHVAVRLWHFPVDAPPTGFVDIYVEARDADDTAVQDLLPELGFTVAEPAVENVDAQTMTDAVRRLSLSAAQPDDRDEPALLAKAEWIGVAGGWVAYAVSADHDVAALQTRLEDIDEVFAGLDLAASAPTGGRDDA